MSRSNRLGLTRTQAHSATNRGYPHHAVLPVNQARPTLANVQYLAVPVAEEGVMLYAFANPDDAVAFKNDYGAESL